MTWRNPFRRQPTVAEAAAAMNAARRQSEHDRIIAKARDMRAEMPGQVWKVAL